jgi:hypothetical protein
MDPAAPTGFVYVVVNPYTYEPYVFADEDDAKALMDTYPDWILFEEPILTAALTA